MKQLAKKITLFFVKRKDIKEEDIDVYIYCFEILLSTILNFVILLVAAVVFKMYYQTTIFAIVFILSRKFMGGYHAKTHRGCVITLIFLYAVYVLLFVFVEDSIINYLSLAFCCFCFFPIFAFAPVINQNNILPNYKIKKYKTISRGLCICVLIFNILSIFYNLPYKLGYCVSFPMFCVVCSMILEKIIRYVCISGTKNCM